MKSLVPIFEIDASKTQKEIIQKINNDINKIQNELSNIEEKTIQGNIKDTNKSTNKIFLEKIIKKSYTTTPHFRIFILTHTSEGYRIKNIIQTSEYEAEYVAFITDDKEPVRMKIMNNVLNMLEKNNKKIKKKINEDISNKVNEFLPRQNGGTKKE